MATWMVVGCTPRLDSNGCYGYTYDPGLKRGTLLKLVMSFSSEWPPFFI